MKMTFHATSEAVRLAHASVEELRVECDDNRFLRDEVEEIELILSWALSRLDHLESRMTVPMRNHVVLS